MIQLGYSTSGLTNLNLFQAIEAVEEAGFSGIELSLHKEQFNPFQISNQELARLKKELKKRNIKPACINSATFFFQPERPHDPSLICIDLAGRKQRIHLIKEAIRLAKILEVPIVSCGSGFIRDEHLMNPLVDPESLLIDSIYQCVEDCGDVVLVIEPEPGMYIETLEQGVNLVKKVNLESFRLHIDLCHAFCSDGDYIEAIRQAAAYTKYLHVSDTSDGYNLKVITFKEDIFCNLNFASYLIYFPETANFLFIDRECIFYFYDRLLSDVEKLEIERFAQKFNENTVQYIDYNQLYMGPSSYESEIKVYAISIPNISWCIIDRVKPIVNYLKTTKSDRTHKYIIEKKVANTLTGKVHFHELPGTGQIDFTACFNALKEKGFYGYAVVELYHHVDIWKETLQQSFSYLSKCLEPE